MGLSLSIRISPALEMRYALEARLSQGLFVQQKLVLSLKLYLKREDVLTGLYRKALERGKVRKYAKHGMEFEYARVSQKDVPDELKAYGNWAFSHCLYNAFEAFLLGSRYAMARGSWLLFVVDDMYPNTPQEYFEYAAVHERGEQVTLGDHNLASKFEFAIAREEGKLVDYMDWLEDRCPAKFADVFGYQVHLDLPDAAEFQEILESQANSDEAGRIRQMIEQFEWPIRLLRKLNLYKAKSETAEEMVHIGLRAANAIAGDATFPLNRVVRRIQECLAEKLLDLRRIGLTRYISYPRMDAFWHQARVELDQQFFAMLTNRKAGAKEEEANREIIAAGVESGLPRTGVLAMSFSEALRSAELAQK